MRIWMIDCVSKPQMEVHLPTPGSVSLSLLGERSRLGAAETCNRGCAWYRTVDKDPLPLRLWHRAQQRRFIMAHPIIDADECIACGVCVDACPAGVLELNDVATVADEDSCVACGACQDACPAGAITEIAED